MKLMYDDAPPPALIPPGPKLTFKQREPEVAPPVDRHRDPVDRRTGEKKSRRKKKAKVVKPGSAALQSLAGFAFVALLLGGLLYHQVHGLGFLSADHASLLRIVLVGGFWLVLMIEAFTADMMQGLFCVFFPPYAFVYGLLFSDAGPLRGLTFGMLLFLGSEIYFTPGDALALHIRDGVQEVIQKGQSAILDEPRKDPRH